MLDFLKRLFGVSKPEQKTPEVSYKVEAPEPIVLSPVVVTAKPEVKVEVTEPAKVEEKPTKAKKPSTKKAKTATTKTTAKKEPKLKRSK